jgi:uncharacterized protein YutE (UPF0331/DUF86 family)
MIDNVILNKIAVITRCLQRIEEEYQYDEDRLQNYTIQDAIVLNLQRACQATIDLAMHFNSVHPPGLTELGRDNAMCDGFGWG